MMGKYMRTPSLIKVLNKDKFETYSLPIRNLLIINLNVEIGLF